MIATLSAALFGVQIIEIHMTSNKKKNFIDNPVSFDYHEFRQLLEMIRIADTIKKPVRKNN
jgi:sialic acid synthase SpsE